MYNEILKIIEGGLNKDRNKVISYSKLLADNLSKDGDEKFSNKINEILEKRALSPMYLDSFINSPVDQESRLSMIDVSIPNENVDLILPSYLEERIEEFVMTIKEQSKLNKLGIDVNSSLLLYGPPGTGKTSIAHLISYKTKLPLVVVRLDSLVSSLLGNTSKNIRRIFDFANSRPCILFLDEFDAIAKARDDSKELGELKRVINSLLQNIDEFNKNNILIAATNHHEMLDSAIWRRFPMRLEILPPQQNDIQLLLKKYLSKAKYDFKDNEKKIKMLSDALNGLSAADIKTICYNSIRKSVLSNLDEVKYNDFIYEIYMYINHSLKDVEDAVRYLKKYGVQQRSIYKILNIPFRQVGSILK